MEREHYMFPAKEQKKGNTNQIWCNDFKKSSAKHNIPETIHELPLEDSVLNISMGDINNIFPGGEINIDSLLTDCWSSESTSADSRDELFGKGKEDIQMRTEDLLVNLDVTKMPNNNLMSVEDKAVQTTCLVALRRKLNLNDTVSTPPAELKKQIFGLMNELDEIHDFHDRELQILTEGNDDSASEEPDAFDLRTSLSDAKNLILDANKEICLLKEKNSELSEKLEVKFVEFEEAKQELESRISNLQNDLKKKNYHIENLEKDRMDYEYRMQLMSDKHISRLKELEAALDDARLLSGDYTKSVKEPEETIKELQESLQKINEKNRVLTESNESLVQRVKEEEEKVRQIETICLNLTDEKNDLKLKIEEFRGLNYDLTIEKETLKTSNSNLELELSSRETQITDLVSKISDLSVAALESKNFKELFDEIRCQYSELESEREKLNGLLDIKCKDVENLKFENVSLIEQLVHKVTELQKLKEQLNVSAEFDNEKAISGSSGDFDFEKKRVLDSSIQDILTGNCLNCMEMETKFESLKIINEMLSHIEIDDVTEKLKVEHEVVTKDLKQIFENDLQELIRGKEQLSHELDVVTQEIEMLKERYSEMEKVKLNLENDLTNIKEQHESEANNWKAEKGELCEVIKLKENEIKAEKETLNKIIKQKDDEITSVAVNFQIEIDNMKSNHEENIKSKDDEIKMLKSEKDELNRMINDKEEDLKLLYNNHEVQQLKLLTEEKLKTESEMNTDFSYFFGENLELLGNAVEDSQFVNDELGNKSREETMSEADDFSSCRSEVAEDFIAEEFVCKTENVSFSETQITVKAETTLQDDSLGGDYGFEKEIINLLLNSEMLNQDELGQNPYKLLMQKFMALLDIYSKCKNEYDEYRKSQDTKNLEFFETLCSQLEASDSTLNFSDSTINSLDFSSQVRSSTMMLEASELETTVVDDVTLATKDPLSLTNMETPAKTPLHDTRKFALLNSAISKIDSAIALSSNLFPTPARTPFQSLKKSNFMSAIKENVQSKKGVDEKEKLGDLKNKISFLEETISEKIKFVEKMETRILHLEEVTCLFDEEKVKILSNHEKDLKILKSELTEKTEELRLLKEKLVCEILCLNPSLKSSITQSPLLETLSIFMEAIMKSCMSVQAKICEEERQSNLNLLEDLKSQNKAMTEQLHFHEAKISEFNKHVQDLQASNEELMRLQAETEEALLMKNEEINSLKTKVSYLEKLKNQYDSEKISMDILKQEVEGFQKLKIEVEEKDKVLKDLKERESFYGNVKSENEDLRTKISFSEQTIEELKTEINLAKEEQNNNEIKVQELIKEIELLKETLSEGDVKNKALENMLGEFEIEIDGRKKDQESKIAALEILSSNLLETETRLKVSEDMVCKLEKTKTEVEQELNSQIQELNQNKDEMESINNELKQKIASLEETIRETKASQAATIESLNKKLTTTEEQFKENNDKVNAANDKLIEKITSLEETIKSDKEIQESQSRTIETLNNKLTFTENQFNENNGQLNAANDELKKKVASLEETIKTSEELKENQAEIIETLNKKLTSAENEFNESNNKLNAANNELKEKVANLEETIKINKEIQENQVAAIETLKKKLTETEDQFNENRNKLKEQISNLEETIRTDREIQETQATTIKTLNTKLMSTEKRFQTDISQKDEVVAFLNQRVEELNSDGDKMLILSSALNEAENKTKMLEATISELKSKLEMSKELENHKNLEIEEIRGKLVEAENQLQEHSERSEEMASKLNSRITELTTTNNELNLANTALNSVEERNKEMKILIAELEVKLEGVKHSEESKTTELETLQTLLAETEEKLKANVEESKQSSAQLYSVNQELQCLNNQLASLEEKNKSLQELVLGLEEKVKKSEEGEKVKSSEIELLSNKISETEDLMKLNQAENDKIVSELNARLEKLTEDHGQFQVLNVALSYAQTEKNELEVKVSNLEEAGRVKNFEISELKDKILEKEEALLKLKSQLEEFTCAAGNLGVLKKELSNAEKVNAELKETILGLEKNIQTIKEEGEKKICLLTAELLETEGKLKINEETAQKLFASIEKLNVTCEQYEVMTTAFAEAEAKNEAFEKKITDLENELQLRCDAENVKNAVIDVINEELVGAQESLRINMKQSDQTIFNLRTCIQKLTSDHRKLEPLNQALIETEEKKSELQSMVHFLEQKLKEEESKTAEITLIRRKLVETEEKLQISASNSEEIVKKLNIEMQTNVTNANMIAVLNSALSDAQTKHKELEKVIECVQQELKAEKSKVEVLSGELTESEEEKKKGLIEKEKVVEKMDQLNAAILEKEGEINKLMSEVKNCFEKSASDKEEFKKLQKIKDNATEVLLDLQENFGLPKDTVLNIFNESQGNKFVFRDRVNELKRFKMEEIEKLKREIETLKSNLNEVETLKKELEVTCQEQLDELNDLRANNLSLQSEVSKKSRKSDFSHSLNSRRLDRLEELNKLLSETLYAIVKLTGVPNYDHLNLCSVRNYENTSKQIIDHISNVFRRSNNSPSGDVLDMTQGSFTEPLLDLTYLRENLLHIQKRIGLSDTVFHRKETITNKINALLETEMKKVELLHQENTMLRAESEELQKGISEANSKINELEKIKESYTNEIQRLKTEASSVEKPKRTRKSDLCGRRLDKLEELNQYLVDLITKVADITKVPKWEKMNLFSVRNFDYTKKQILDHLNDIMESKTKEMEELKSQIANLDEECNLCSEEITKKKKEAVKVWQERKKEKQEYEAKISTLIQENTALIKKVTELEVSSPEIDSLKKCQCDALLKELELLKKEKICQLQEIENQCSSYKSEIKYLENLLDQYQKKLHEEKEKYDKLDTEMRIFLDGTNPKKTDSLRMRGTSSGGIVQDIVEKEKIRKLMKDNGVLKDLCRTRYAEIKKLEAENNSLKNVVSKNCNQMDSPIRTRSNARSKVHTGKEVKTSPWKMPTNDKENQN